MNSSLSVTEKNFKQDVVPLSNRGCLSNLSNRTKYILVALGLIGSIGIIVGGVYALKFVVTIPDTRLYDRYACDIIFIGILGVVMSCMGACIIYKGR